MTTENPNFQPPVPAPERAALPVGATLPLDDMRYPQLYDHSQQLGRLAEWDGHNLFAATGMLMLGAGLGALIAGVSIGHVGVAVCIVLGLALLVGSLFIKRARVVDARELKLSFDKNLSLYEIQNPEIQEMRQHLDSIQPAEPRTTWQHTRHFFNF
jgi:hypothetical protein